MPRRSRIRRYFRALRPDPQAGSGGLTGRTRRAGPGRRRSHPRRQRQCRGGCQYCGLGIARTARSAQIGRSGREERGRNNIRTACRRGHLIVWERHRRPRDDAENGADIREGTQRWPAMRTTAGRSGSRADSPDDLRLARTRARLVDLLNDVNIFAPRKPPNPTTAVILHAQHQLSRARRVVRASFFPHGRCTRG